VLKRASLEFVLIENGSVTVNGIDRSACPVDTIVAVVCGHAIAG